MSQNGLWEREYEPKESGTSPTLSLFLPVACPSSCAERPLLVAMMERLAVPRQSEHTNKFKQNRRQSRRGSLCRQEPGGRRDRATSWGLSRMGWDGIDPMDQGGSSDQSPLAALTGAGAGEGRRRTRSHVTLSPWTPRELGMQAK